MSTRNLTRAALGVAVLAASLAAAFAAEPMGVPAQSGSIQVVGSDTSSRFVQLGIGKSVVIDLPRDIKDVLAAEPKFANAVVRSTRRAYLIGVAVGQTNIYFFDAEGRQIAGFDVAVNAGLHGRRRMAPELPPAPGGALDAAGEGAGGRDPHAGGTDPDRDLGREREFPGWRRVSGTRRLHLRPDDARLPACHSIQEVRCRAELHACRALGRPHQPEGADRGVRTLERERDSAGAGY